MSRRNWYVLVAATCTAAIVAYFLVGSNGCPMQQLALEQDIKKYGSSPDPESCAAINERISGYDSQCKASFEILDCG
ncbi:MAG TPA: hypothetical protein VJ792_08440 [Candidatus Nitrosotalea sp.]|nr:hypothetical protein [Candidatus Nitrosotalea sp.]